MDNKSPSPQGDVRPPEEDLPKCQNCKLRIEKIKWMDYGDVRLVIHDSDCIAVIGVLKNG